MSYEGRIKWTVRLTLTATRWGKSWRAFSRRAGVHGSSSYTNVWGRTKVSNDRIVPPSQRIPVVCNHCGDADAFNAGGDLVSGAVSVHHFSGKICKWDVKPGDLLVRIGTHEIRVPLEEAPIGEEISELTMDQHGKTTVTPLKRVLPERN